MTLSGHSGAVISIDFSPDGRWLASASWDRTVRVWDTRTKLEVRRLTGFERVASIVRYSPTGSWLAAAGSGNLIKIWDVRTWRVLHTLRGHSGSIESLAFSPDGRWLMSGSHDGSVRFWNPYSGAEMAILVTGRNSSDWFSLTGVGFFDGTRSAWQLAPFRFASEPFKLFEPEQFFNQFYQPGLLTDIYREGRSMRNILRDQGDPRANLDISRYRNSNLPELRIVTSGGKNKTSKKTVAVTIVARDTGSGLRDLRVFRNQSLVHFEHGDLQPNPQYKTFSLTVPVKLVAGENKITAYVFNRDDLKSKDAGITVIGAGSLQRKGTAYLFSIGINEYANPDFNLSYAVSDARAITQIVGQSLKRLGDYADVVAVELLDRDATWANILAAFTRLAGVEDALPAGAPPSLRKLYPAQPEDSVIVFFAGHGTADGDRYYLIPHNLGYKGPREQMDARGRSLLFYYSISDQELEKNLELIDAGRIMLIIDACQSGQALVAEEKRRGPMNSRGLAQLAYEKGMYILAAAQSYQAALEFEKLGHGLLTYTLIEEGLQQMAADTNPKDRQLTVREWLEFGVQRVPKETTDASERYVRRTNREIDFGEETVTGQAPRAYYRREMIAGPWVMKRQ